MRKVGWQWKIILFLMFAGLFCPVKVHAEEAGSYLSEFSDEMDYGKLDTFLENYGVEQVSFSGLVEELMQDGVSTFVHYILKRRREVYEKENVP